MRRTRLLSSMNNGELYVEAWRDIEGEGRTGQEFLEVTETEVVEQDMVLIAERREDWSFNRSSPCSNRKTR